MDSTACEGVTVQTVIGPPGTGKTQYVARQVALAVEAGETPTVVSLTRTAAKEAAGRVPLSRGRVSTLHSQAFRALGTPEIADTPRNIRRWNAAHPGLRLGVTRDLDEDNAAAPAVGVSGDDLMIAYQNARARRRPISSQPGRVQRFAALWEAWKQSEGMLDFTDLIEQALERVATAPGDPSVLFADEAQDMSQLDMALVEKWGAAAGRLIRVGDPLQNIYEWRGADARVMGVADRILAQSYRIPRAVHERAMAWIQKMPGYQPIEYAPRDEDGEVRWVDSTWKDPYELLSKVEADVKAGKTAMILGTCEYMLRPTIKLMRERAIPFHNPYRLRQTAWNPLRSQAASSPAARVLGFLSPSRQGVYYLSDVLAWIAAIQRGVLTVRKKDFKDLPTDPDGYVDTEALTNALTRAAMDALLSGDLDWLAAHLLPKYQGTVRYAIAVASKHGVGELEREPQVTIGTVHSAKGGEADSVYLFPDLSKKGMAAWYDSRAPVYRTMYVGMTRARETLTLLQPAGRKAVSL